MMGVPQTPKETMISFANENWMKSGQKNKHKIKHRHYIQWVRQTQSHKNIHLWHLNAVASTRFETQTYRFGYTFFLLIENINREHSRCRQTQLRKCEEVEHDGAL